MSSVFSRHADIEPHDSPGVDAFGRWRVSSPFAEFESKQIFDNQPLFWDEKLESGADITSAHSTATASTVITSTNAVAGKFTRQTFMRFNYQPGNGQLVYMTGVLDRRDVRRRCSSPSPDAVLYGTSRRRVQEHCL